MKIALAPWELTGEGFILVYKFQKGFVDKNCFLDHYQADNFVGGLGTVMCVNYQTSNVGPYLELLFIPGVINLKTLNLAKIKSGFTISKIYVSTRDSVENGINNWGIPKQLADFQWNELADNQVEVKISIDGKVFFYAIFKRKSFKFPITTSIIPLKIIQKIGNKYFQTKPTAKGKSSFAKLKKLEIEGNFFPKIESYKPLIVTNISNFKMVFPEAIVENKLSN